MPNVQADHLVGSSDSASYNPQMQQNFEVIISLPGSGAAGGSDAGGDVLQLSTKAIDFPKDSSAVKELHYMNEVRKYAGKTTYEDITWTLYDYVSQETLQKIRDWRKKVFDPDTGCIGEPADYKADGEIHLLGPCGEDSRVWELRGVWPSNVDTGAGDMTSDGDPVEIAVTLTVDQAVFTGGGT